MGAYWDAVLAEASLQSLWKLNEAAGSVSAADSKGTVTGTYNLTAPGAAGQPRVIQAESDTSVRFDPAGNPNNVTLGDFYDFVGTANYTLEAWITIRTFGAGDARIMSKRATSGTLGGYEWSLNSTSLFSTRLDSAGVSDQATWTHGWKVGQTHYVAVTYDGSNIRLFADGDATAKATQPSTRSLANTVASLLIASFSGGGNIYDGNMQGVAVYNVALSGDTLANHYVAGGFTGLFNPFDPVPFMSNGRI